MRASPSPLVIVDLFAGGGGASEGIRQGLGVSPVVAINHDMEAIEMHARNHPGTLHLCEDLFRVQPFRPKRGRGIDLLWGSPDCTHHSRAKGGKPLESGRRMLAWVMVEWAREVQPRVIILENVQEFVDWGPLDKNGRPIKSRKGETFREFVAALKLAGYRVEWQILNAADFGAPTSRRRLFMVARCDGQPIVWPEPTHGPGRTPYRTAAECIDWTRPMLSIFASPAEAEAYGRAQWAEDKLTDPKARLGIPQRPLADATQRRIAAGVKRYVLDAAQPFLITTGHQSDDSGKVRSIHQPVSTIVTKNEHCLVVPSMVQIGYGERVAGRHSRSDQKPRVLDLHAPLTTVVAAGQKHALVGAFLLKNNGSGEDWAKAIGQDLRTPIHTVTATDSKGLVQVSLADHRRDLGNAKLVAAFLTKFYGEGGQLQRVDEPLHTIPTLDRFGLVTVEIDGSSYVISDIAMRMLEPRELATAQGFGPEYVLTGSRRSQIARIGNSVCPPVARAVVQAQFGEAPDLEVQAA